jgi:putative toxin-antitoxin system antitoxin component (TIGR02293 family)
MPGRTLSLVPKRAPSLGSTLTRREREVAGLAAKGRSARVVAEQLGISERTVETHLASIYRKLGAGSRSDLGKALVQVDLRERANDAEQVLRSLDRYHGVSMLDTGGMTAAPDALALATAIRGGLRPMIWGKLRELGFSITELAAVVGVSEKTIWRKQSSREALDIVEGDRTMRLATVALEAAQAFGDLEKALRWLRKPNRVLGFEKPLDLIATEPGVALVRRALGTIEYGGLA